MVGDKAQLRSSVCYKHATIAVAATGGMATQFSATGSVVTDSEPKHSTLTPGWRQEEQLTTCLSTWELLQDR